MEAIRDVSAKILKQGALKINKEVKNTILNLTLFTF